MLDLNQEEHNRFIKEIEENDFGTSLLFLQQHNGFRRGKLHTILGVASGGKSTLRNTLIIDFILNNPDKKILLWLSEERIQDFKVDAYRNYDIFKHAKNLDVFSEIEDSYLFNDTDSDFAVLESKFHDCHYDIVFFDNPSTSILWGHTPTRQSNFYRKAKALTINKNCSLIFLNHTRKGVVKFGNTYIDQSDFKGSSTIEALTEFLYVLQSFKVADTTLSTIRIAKHRGFPVEDTLFKFNFNAKRVIYDQCIMINQNDLKEYISNQKKMGF